MLVHPFDDRAAAVVSRSVDDTALDLGDDANGYRTLVGSVAASWPLIEDVVLSPPHLPRHPVAAARFGLRALQPAVRLASRCLSTERARALFAGVAAHGMLPLDTIPSGAIGLVLGALAHAVGWPFPRGGAQTLANALASYLQSLGGRIVTNAAVSTLDELPAAQAILCDLSPQPLLRVAASRLPAWYRQKLARYRFGMGTFKVDWALDAPVPWRDERVARSATVHLGGTLQEIADSERDAVAQDPLVAGHLHADRVGAGIEEGRLEITGVIRREVLADAGIGVRDRHRGAGNHAVLVTNHSGDLAACFLCRHAQRQRQTRHEALREEEP